MAQQMVPPALSLATVVVGELVQLGVTDIVLCPGSRSAPLAYAAQAAHGAGQIRLWVRIDERSAGFFGLGLAKASGRAVALVTTSGTAVANLIPALLEARHSHLPLLALTADRPASLVGSGANQTTDQLALLRPVVREQVRLSSETGFVDTSWRQSTVGFSGDGAGLPEAGWNPPVSARAVAAWRSAIHRAWTKAMGTFDHTPGPVHVNIELTPPLVGELPVIPPASFPFNAVLADSVAPVELPAGPRTVVVAGDLPVQLGRWWAEACQAAGVPLLAEPSSNARHSAASLPHYRRLLEVASSVDSATPLCSAQNDDRELADLALADSDSQTPLRSAQNDGKDLADLALAGRGVGYETPATWGAASLVAGIERVLVVGHPTLSRPINELLSRTDLEIIAVSDTADWIDPGWAVSQVVPGFDCLQQDANSRHSARAQRSRRIHTDATMDAAPQRSVTGEEDGAEETPAVRLPQSPPGWLESWQRAEQLLPKAGDPLVPVVAAVLGALEPGHNLVLGSSRAIRLADDQASWPAGVAVYANRGLAGIDGTIATALGVAAASGAPTTALIGDLTAVHDLTSLVIPQLEAQIDLRLVILDDHGGTIFRDLEYGHCPPGSPAAAAFERVFLTPSGVDLAAAAGALGAHSRRVQPDGLLAALATPAGGIDVIVVNTNAG